MRLWDTGRKAFKLQGEGDAPKSRGPKRYRNQQRLLLTAFPAGQAARKHYFAAKMLFLKATVPEVAFCRKNCLLLLWGKGN